MTVTPYNMDLIAYNMNLWAQVTSGDLKWRPQANVNTPESIIRKWYVPGPDALNEKSST